MDPAETIAANKGVVLRFYEAMNTRNLKASLALFADGAKIVVVMDGPFGGEHAPSREFTQSFFDTFPEIVFTVGTMTAEEDRVAVEVTSRGVLRNGEPYRNHYHNLFIVGGEKIRLFKEYPTGYTGD